MAMESAISDKNLLTHFQTLTHQITLLAGLHTLSNLFHYKTKNNLFHRIKDLFHCISNFTIFCMNYHIDFGLRMREILTGCSCTLAYFYIVPFYVLPSV